MSSGRSSVAEIDVQFCDRLCVCVRDVHYKCDITLRFATFRLLRRVSVLIARFCGFEGTHMAEVSGASCCLKNSDDSQSYGRQVKFITYSCRESRERSADSRHLMFNV
jgi:hypothetical protein